MSECGGDFPVAVLVEAGDGRAWEKQTGKWAIIIQNEKSRDPKGLSVVTPIETHSGVSN